MKYEYYISMKRLTAEVTWKGENTSEQAGVPKTFGRIPHILGILVNPVHLTAKG